MDIKEIKRLAQDLTSAELEDLARRIEETGQCPEGTTKDPGELLSNVLQALEVRQLIDQGTPLADAVRAFSARVRQTLA